MLQHWEDSADSLSKSRLKYLRLLYSKLCALFRRQALKHFTGIPVVNTCYMAAPYITPRKPLAA